MATEIGFEIRFTPKDASVKDVAGITTASEQAKASCQLEGLYGKYWFNAKDKGDHVAVELYGYYTNGEEDSDEALENVLEMTWQDEDNGPLIVDQYYKQFVDTHDIKIVRDYWAA